MASDQEASTLWGPIGAPEEHAVQAIENRRCDEGQRRSNIVHPGADVGERSQEGQGSLDEEKRDKGTVTGTGSEKAKDGQGQPKEEATFERWSHGCLTNYS